LSLDQKTNSKITTCHVQFGLLVNMINAEPRIQHVKESSFHGQKVSEHEADHSHPIRTEVKFCGAIPPLPYAFRTSTETTLSL